MFEQLRGRIRGRIEDFLHRRVIENEIAELRKDVARVRAQFFPDPARRDSWVDGDTGTEIDALKNVDGPTGRFGATRSGHQDRS